MDSFFANASFLFAFDQDPARGDQEFSVVQSYAVPSQGVDIRLGLNERGGQMLGLNPNWHHIWVFGQFDHGLGD